MNERLSTIVTNHHTRRMYIRTATTEIINGVASGEFTPDETTEAMMTTMQRERETAVEEERRRGGDAVQYVLRLLVAR